MPEKKIDVLIRLMQTGEWHKAIKYAAKFPRLGEHRDAILTASSALLSPRFYVSLGKDPDKLIEAGIAALKERYAKAYSDNNLAPRS